MQRQECRRDLEGTKHLIILGHGALALEHLVITAILVVCIGGEGLALFRGIVVLRSIIGVATSPAVSIASVNGVTSSKDITDVALELHPEWRLPWQQLRQDCCALKVGIFVSRIFSDFQLP